MDLAALFIVVRELLHSLWENAPSVLAVIGIIILASRSSQQFHIKLKNVEIYINEDSTE